MNEVRLYSVPQWNVPGFMLQGYKDKKDLKPKMSIGVKSGVCDIIIPRKGVF